MPNSESALPGYAARSALPTVPCIAIKEKSMSKPVQLFHRVAALLAAACIATFLFASIGVELFGTPQAAARLKALIVAPGLWLLVPALAATGASGFALSRGRRGRLLDAKKRRMPFIAANGLLVLVPCSIVLQRWAAAGDFGAAFLAVQGIELLAGATNLALIALNVRDGLRLAGRQRSSATASGTAA
jgi:hypothetical protein